MKKAIYTAMVVFLFATSCTSTQRTTSETTKDDTESRMFLMIEEASQSIDNGRFSEAIHKYEQAIRLKPNPSDISTSKARRWAQNNLAWLLATCSHDSVRDGARALTLAEQLVTSYPRDVAYLDSLAAAYAEVGRFKDAVRIAQEAENNIPKHIPTDDPKVIEFKKHWDMYRSNRPWREP